MYTSINKIAKCYKTIKLENIFTWTKQDNQKGLSYPFNQGSSSLFSVVDTNYEITGII